MTDSARLFSIASGRPFLADLAHTLFDDEARQDLFGTSALHEAHILLPTRRAARHLAHEFLSLAEAKGQDALLLPHIATLGDLDEDVPQIGRAPLLVPPAIEPMARHFHLLRLVRAWAAQSGHMEGGNLNPVKLSALAFELESFLDQAQNEQIDWAQLPALVPDELAENWQQTLDFLTIITEYWPAHLAETGCLDPTERRNILLAQRTDNWAANPPKHLVIAAGSTGSIRATADLLRVIAHLPKGAVVLPGLDMQADADLWRHIEHDVSHPQYGLAQTLQHMDTARDQVQLWPSSEAADKRAARLNQALVPADATALWATHQPHTDGKTSDAHDDALRGLHIIDAPDARAEAGVIALIMRETLQDENKTAALVTRDRKLARRVAGELRRWDIIVDDSAGKPLAHGDMAVWLRHILACAHSDFAPVEILALLKHPQSCLAESRAEHMAQLHKLEAALLRGVRPAKHANGGLEALKQTLRQPQIPPIADAELAKMDAFLEAVATAFAPLFEVAKTALMTAHLDALLATAKALSTADAAAALFSDDEEGRALSALVEALYLQADLAGPVDAADWPALFDMWLSRQSLRVQGMGPQKTEKRLAIWGPLEARLMQADVMILGGLNETIWPPMPETGPWLSRPMRAALGMSQPERQIGLAAHDFVQGAAAPVVYLTRAAKIDNAPSVAARWLRRLETLSAKQPRDAQTRLLDWWYRLDHNTADELPALPSQAPSPRPPLSARPNRLSVTQIETLIHNPYEIYARKILKLNPWEPVDAPHHASHRGTLIHAVLEQMVERGLHHSPDLADEILALAHDLQADKPGGAVILAYWQARLAAMGDWMADFEAARRPDVQASFVERSGHMQLDIDAKPFTVSAKADRIDLLKDGRFDIIDYKTGAVPSNKSVQSHLAPQLTLEAAILAEGGFDAVPHGGAGQERDAVRRLSYLHLTGGQPAGKVLDIACDDALINGARDMVTKLIAGYRQVERPYLVHVRPRRNSADAANPYDHLARVKEWRTDLEVADD